MSEFFTWEFIGTFAGIGVFTGVIVQFIKKYIPIPTQILSWIVAFVGLILAQLFTNTLSLSMAILDVFNAILIGAATSGAYDTAKRLKG